jgi:hypothetical protein
MKKRMRRLELKRETLQPLAGGNAVAIDIQTAKNTNQDCTSPLCGPTTCPASCDCQNQTVGGVLLDRN